MFRDVIQYFRSFQGEAPFTGLSALFLRFKRCNYITVCGKFCDTMSAMLYSLTFNVPFEDVVNQIQLYDLKTLTFTGGEPTLKRYRTQIKGFLEAYRLDNVIILIETNGSYLYETYEELKDVDENLYYIWSPKLFNDELLQKSIETLDKVHNVDGLYIKPVVTNRTNGRIEQFLTYVYEYNLNDVTYLMPEAKTIEELKVNSRQAYELALKFKTHISPRLQVSYNFL
jgi:organic radical activating enzyme